MGKNNFQRCLSFFFTEISLWSLTWSQCVRSAMRNSPWSWRRGWRSCLRPPHESKGTRLSSSRERELDEISEWPHKSRFLKWTSFKFMFLWLFWCVINCYWGSFYGPWSKAVNRDEQSLGFTLSCAFLRCLLAALFYTQHILYMFHTLALFHYMKSDSILWCLSHYAKGLVWLTLLL